MNEQSLRTHEGKVSVDIKTNVDGTKEIILPDKQEQNLTNSTHTEQPSSKVNLDNIEKFLQVFSSDNLFAFSIFVILLFFFLAFRKAIVEKRLQWTDLITKIGSNSVSLTKVLQLVGGMVATWVMIKLTIQGALGWEIFGLYLAYVASIEGYSKYVAAKFSSNLSPTNNNNNMDEFTNNENLDHGSEEELYDENKTVVKKRKKLPILEK